MNRTRKFRGGGGVAPKVSPPEGSRHRPRARANSAILRGGRLRKTARGIFTFAPWLGIATAIAMSATLLASTPAAATADESSAPTPKGTCTEQTTGNYAGTITCTGEDGITATIDADISTYKHGIHLPQMENPRGDKGDIALTVNGDITAGESGIFVYRHWEDDDDGDISITANGDITAGEYGIHVKDDWHADNQGNTTIIANGDITAGKRIGVYAKQHTEGDISITTNGDIVSEGRGVRARLHAAGDITITANGDIQAGIGINAVTNRAHPGDMTITANGDITATTGNGIDAAHRNRGITRITNNGAISAKKHGISLVKLWPLDTAANEAVVTVNADITAGHIGIYILANGHREDADAFTVNVNPGVTVTGGNSNPIYNAVSFGGGGTRALNLDSATLIGGILAKQANNAAVNIKGAVSITGASEVVGRLRNPGGALSFDNANTTDTFTVTDFVGGGTLTLNVAFVKDGADTADLFTVTDNIYGAPTTIDITATGDLADLDEDGLLVIDAPASSNTAAFTAGNLAIGETPHGFTLSRDAGSGDWFLRAAAPAPGCHGNNGVFVCSGAITTRRVLSASSGEAISVTDTDGTNFQVYSRYALWVGQTGDADLEVDLDADFTTDTDTHNGASIHASHTGAGDISITADGAIATITGGGIHARHRGAGAVSITANGDIDASRNGIWVDHRGRSGDIAVAANGDIIAEMTDGISVLRGRPRRHLHHRERRHHLPQRRRHQRLSIP